MTADGSLIREMVGMGRCDLSQLLRSPEAFASVVRALAEPFAQSDVGVVVGVDAAGLPFAAGVAFELEAGLAIARREGKAAGRPTRRSAWTTPVLGRGSSLWLMLSDQVIVWWWSTIGRRRGSSLLRFVVLSSVGVLLLLGSRA